MKYSYIIFYSFVEESTGHTRHARAQKEFNDTITSSDLLDFEIEQEAAGDPRPVVTNYKLLNVVQGFDGEDD